MFNAVQALVNAVVCNLHCKVFAPLAVSMIALAGCGSGTVEPIPQPSAMGATSISEKAVGNVVPIYRFARYSNGAYFYTGSKAESDFIQATNPGFRYEGIAFYGYDSGGTTVYRFANVTNGGYFYTASVAERDYVLNDPVDSKRFRLDNATFQVANETDANKLPVYRLANLVNGAYLYTVSAAEASYAVDTLKIWRNEGIKFYSVPMPTATAGCKTGTPFGAWSMDQYQYSGFNVSTALGLLNSFGQAITVLSTQAGASAEINAYTGSLLQLDFPSTATFPDSTGARFTAAGKEAVFLATDASKNPFYARLIIGLDNAIDAPSYYAEAGQIEVKRNTTGQFVVNGGPITARRLNPTKEGYPDTMSLYFCDAFINTTQTKAN
jgi:Repeat of unknown function (DUF5648)